MQLSEKIFLCFVGKIIHFVGAGFMEESGRASLKLQLLNEGLTKLLVSSAAVFLQLVLEHQHYKYYVI